MCSGHKWSVCHSMLPNFPDHSLCFLCGKRPFPPISKPWAGHLHALFQYCDSQLWEQPSFSKVMEPCRLAHVLNLCSCSSTAGEWCSDLRGACSVLPECFWCILVRFSKPKCNFPLTPTSGITSYSPLPLLLLVGVGFCTSWLLLPDSSLKLSWSHSSVLGYCCWPLENRFTCSLCRRLLKTFVSLASMLPGLLLNWAGEVNLFPMHLWLLPQMSVWTQVSYLRAQPVGDFTFMLTSLNWWQLGCLTVSRVRTWRGIWNPVEEGELSGLILKHFRRAQQSSSSFTQEGWTGIMIVWLSHAAQDRVVIGQQSQLSLVFLWEMVLLLLPSEEIVGVFK